MWSRFHVAIDIDQSIHRMYLLLNLTVSHMKSWRKVSYYQMIYIYILFIYFIGRTFGASHNIVFCNYLWLDSEGPYVQSNVTYLSTSREYNTETHSDSHNWHEACFRSNGHGWLVRQIAISIRASTVCHVTIRASTNGHVITWASTVCHVTIRASTYCHVITWVIHILSRDNLSIHRLSRDNLSVHSLSRDNQSIHILSRDNLSLHILSRDNLSIHRLSRDNLSVHSLSRDN